MAVNNGDVLRAVANGRNDIYGAVVNSYQLKYVGVGSLAEADVLSDIIELLEALYALIGTILSTAYVIDNIRVVNETQLSDVGIAAPTDTTPGSDAGTRYPPQLAYVLNLYTPYVGVRGRKYFGPTIITDANSVGVLAAPTVVALADVGDFMTADQVATNGVYEFGITTLNHGWQQFTGFQVSALLGVQRRRKTGVGI
jgi:hypothetical protein